MKKISLCFAVIILVTLLSVNVSATSLADSLRIGRETYEMLGGVEGDTVVRLYHGDFLAGSAEGLPISALTGDEHVSSQIFMTRTRRGGETYRTIKDGELRLFERPNRYADGGSIYEVASKPDRLFDRKVDVDNVYCFDDEADAGIYIYFVTDSGDYVYYRQSAENKNEYLFPAETFVEFARSVVDGHDGGDAFDMTPYLLCEDTDFFMIAAAVIAALGILSLCGCGVLLRK